MVEDARNEKIPLAGGEVEGSASRRGGRWGRVRVHDMGRSRRYLTTRGCKYLDKKRLGFG